MLARGATKLIFIRSLKMDDYSSLSSLVTSFLNSRRDFSFANLNLAHPAPQYCSIYCCHRADIKRAGQTRQRPDFSSTIRLLKGELAV